MFCFNTSNLIYQNLKKIIIDLCLIILLLPTKIRYKILDIPSRFDLSQIHIRRKQGILSGLNHIPQTLICIVLHSHNQNIELNDIKTYDKLQQLGKDSSNNCVSVLLRFIQWEKFRLFVFFKYIVHTILYWKLVIV